MYVVWVFIFEISEGDVADKGMLGLKRVGLDCRIDTRLWDTYCNQ